MVSNRALWIGKLQPGPHFGHIKAISRILAMEDELVLAICSAQKDMSFESPSTAKERHDMLDIITRQMGVRDRVHIIPMHDVNDPDRFLSVLTTLAPQFDRVYSASDKVLSLFSSYGFDANYLEKEHIVSGKDIRRFMLEGNDKWKAFMPYSVVEYMNANNIIKRVQAFGQTTNQPSISNTHLNSPIHSL